jgi:hypothetical protein
VVDEVREQVIDAVVIDIVAFRFSSPKSQVGFLSSEVGKKTIVPAGNGPNSCPYCTFIPSFTVSGLLPCKSVRVTLSLSLSHRRCSGRGWFQMQSMELDGIVLGHQSWMLFSLIGSASEQMLPSAGVSNCM